MAAALGNNDSPSFPRSGELVREVWEVSYPGLAATAAEAVRQWGFVSGSLPRSAGLSTDAGGEIFGGVCRSAALGGLHSSAEVAEGRWQSGCGVAASSSSATGWRSGTAMAVCVQRLRFRRGTADRSCGLLQEWRWSSSWACWWPVCFLSGHGAGGEEERALRWLCALSSVVFVVVLCRCTHAYVIRLQRIYNF